MKAVDDRNARKLDFKYGSEARFMSEKVILIDGAGWGDLLLGVVIGAINPPDPRYIERRIPVSSFQPPNFENQ